jgi:hypothetical protein
MYRERGRERVLAGLEGYHSTKSPHFEIFYMEPDIDVIPMILETAERVYKPVVETMRFEPTGRVPLIIYPNRTELRSAFGWGSGESAMGVYWAGTIRLLSPNVWLPGKAEAEREAVFAKLNPIAHELTHYILDYMTSGNYPRWFTEGLAQWIEYDVSGFLWLEPQNRLDQELYTLHELENSFDRLPNQSLAYRQSHLIVEYIAITYGEEQISELILRLAGGTNFARALNQTLGRSMPQLYEEWAQWVRENHHELERDR